MVFFSFPAVQRDCSLINPDIYWLHLIYICSFLLLLLDGLQVLFSCGEEEKDLSRGKSYVRRLFL